MVDHLVEAGAAPKRVRRDRRAAALAEAAPPALAPGEAAAHPPEATAHWDLRVRVGIVLGLATLSWAVVGGAVLLLLRH